MKKLLYIGATILFLLGGCSSPPAKAPLPDDAHLAPGKAHRVKPTRMEDNSPQRVRPQSKANSPQGPVRPHSPR